MNKVLHLYWGRNRPLSWLQLMTVASFHRHNREWKIIVHIPSLSDVRYDQQWKTGEHRADEIPVRDWFASLSRWVTFRVERIDLPKGCSEVHRSDLLRWKILAEEGGLWSDFDIFYFQPVKALFKSIFSWDVTLCQQSGGQGDWYPIGFLASAGTPDAKRFWKQVETEAWNFLDAGEYQSAGRFALEFALLSDEARHLRCRWIPESRIYPIRPAQLGWIWAFGKIHPLSTIGLHWYAGHWKSQQVMSRFITGPESLTDALCAAHPLAGYLRRCWNEV